LERKTEELAQANRRLVLLNQVANTLILGDAPQDQLKAAFEAVAREVGAQYFFNYAVDTKEPGTLVLAASGGLDPARERDFGRIGFGQLLSGQVAQSGRPLIVENVHLRDDEPTKAARALGIKAYAGFPLLAHGRLFGTLAFGSTGNARFAESDVDLLRALADQFAATLDRGRLLSNLRESETRYRAALTAGRMGSWETDFAAGTRTWSEEGMALFGLRLPHGRGQIGATATSSRLRCIPRTGTWSSTSTVWCKRSTRLRPNIGWCGRTGQRFGCPGADASLLEARTAKPCASSTSPPT
jgi:GAF domain-containing protein